jgi:hypothetical protein
MALLVLPDMLVWREEGRLAYCTCCNIAVPASNEKLIKQNCKSRTHKQASQFRASAKEQTAGEAPQSSTDQQHEQHSSAVSSPANCLVAPNDYQQQHFEALHIAGQYSADSSYAGLFYYTTEQPAAQLTDLQDAGADGSQMLAGDSLESKASSSSNSAESGLATSTQQQQQQQQMRPCWPPAFAMRPKAALAAGKPFLTLACGSIPCVSNTYLAGFVVGELVSRSCPQLGQSLYATAAAVPFSLIALLLLTAQHPAVQHVYAARCTCFCACAPTGPGVC